MAEANTKCLQCGISFSSRSNLQKHSRKFHGASRIYKNPSLYKFTCTYCGKNFNANRSYNEHFKSHPSESSKDVTQPRKINSKQCPLCDFNSSKRDILKHFRLRHDVTIQQEEIKFVSETDFNVWKSKMESETSASFIRSDSISSQTNQIVYFTCNRGGRYKPSIEARQRHIKTQGTCKIGAYCPAGMKMIKNKETNSCTVYFISTHIGHQMELQHIFLKKEEREHIAQQIASKIPFSDILDDVRDAVTEDLQRIDLLTRKDLYNIAKSFNLGSTAIRHNNDAISVDAWVAEMRESKNCVLFYKPQGIALEDTPMLREEDFILIIMSPAQKEFLLKYGLDVICIDETHGMNSYDFELTTLLVIDDLREGFPCSFLISNRSDKDVFSLFFSKIKNETSVITPSVFMSDLANAYYTAWIEIMGVPQKRLYCTWHVDRAWRTNLKKIKSTERQTEIYKQLRVLLEERDVNTFEKMLNSFINLKDLETEDFITYFRNHYACTKENWAYAYRQHAGVNTNMHLESLHRVMKYVYLQGKRVKRLDKAIHGIMKLVRDKLFDRLIARHKGKITSKIKEIRKRHKNMAALNENLILETESGWEVSSENLKEIYIVEEMEKKCSKCQLICEVCQICIHQYHCSCVDSSIKFNMCKHIHLIAYKKLQIKRGANISCDNKENDSDNALEIEIESEDIEKQVILGEVTQKVGKLLSLEEQKEKISMEFHQQLNSIQSPSKLEIVKKVIAPLSATLAAASKSENVKLPTAPKIPHNKKIECQRVQRKLWSTKKKCTSRNLSKMKPTSSEAEKIAYCLVNSGIN